MGLLDALEHEQCRWGEIERLVLRISWSSLFKKPIVLEVDGLRILATALNSDSEGTTAQDVAQFAAQVKARLVESLTEAAAARQVALKEEEEEERKRKKQESGGKTKKAGGSSTSIGDSLKARILARFVDNVVIKFTNIHLRFEAETLNDLDSVAALDFRIGNITVQSAAAARANALREQHAASRSASGASGASGTSGASGASSGRGADEHSSDSESGDSDSNGTAVEGGGGGGSGRYTRTKTDKQVFVEEYSISCVPSTPATTSLSALVAAECTREAIVDAFDALGVAGGSCDLNAILGPASIHGTVAADAPLLPSDPGLPAYALELDFRSVQVAVTDKQYSRLNEMLAVLKRIQLQLASAHLRPRQSVATSSAAWWRYGADAHLAQHPRRRSAWCWTTIKSHCVKRRAYIDLCIKALADPKDEQLVATVKAYEQFMSPHRIVLYRQLARCESLFETAAEASDDDAGSATAEATAKKKSRGGLGRFNVKKKVKSLLKMKKKPGDNAAKLEAEFNELRSELQSQLDLENAAATSELTTAELTVGLKASRFDIALFAEALDAGSSGGGATRVPTSARSTGLAAAASAARGGIGTQPARLQFDRMIPVCKIAVGGVAVRSFTGLREPSRFECTVDKVDLLLPGADGALRHAMTPTGRGCDRGPVFAGVSDAPCLFSRSIAALVVETTRLPQALDAVAQSQRNQLVRSKSRFSVQLNELENGATHTVVAGYVLPVELKVTQAGALALSRFFKGTPPGATFESPCAHPVVRLNEVLAAKVRRHLMTVVLCIEAPTVVMAASDNSDPTTPMVIMDLGSHVVTSGGRSSHGCRFGSSDSSKSNGGVKTGGGGGGTVDKEETVAIKSTGIQVLVACRSDEWRASQRLENSEHHVVARMHASEVVDKTHDAFNVACRAADCNIQLPAASLEHLVRIIQAWAAVLAWSPPPPPLPPLQAQASLPTPPRSSKRKRRRGPAFVAPRTVGTTALSLSCPAVRVSFGKTPGDWYNGTSSSNSSSSNSSNGSSSSNRAGQSKPAMVATLVNCKMQLVATDLAAHCDWTVHGAVVMNCVDPEVPQILVHSIAANRDGASRASVEAVEAALRSNPRPSLRINWNNKMFPLETASTDTTRGAATAVVKGGSIELSDWMVLVDRDPSIALVEGLSSSVLAVQLARAAFAASAEAAAATASDGGGGDSGGFGWGAAARELSLPALPRRRGRAALRWAQKKMAGKSASSVSASPYAGGLHSGGGGGSGRGRRAAAAAAAEGDGDVDDLSTSRIGAKGQKIWTDKATRIKPSIFASDWTVSITDVSVLLLRGTPVLRANLPTTEVLLKRRAVYTQLEMTLSQMQILDLTESIMATSPTHPDSTTSTTSTGSTSSTATHSRQQHRQLVGAREGHGDGCVKIDLKFIDADEEPHELKIGLFHLEAIVLARISAELSGFLTPLFSASDRTFASRAVTIAERKAVLMLQNRPARPARPVRKPSAEEMVGNLESHSGSTSLPRRPPSGPMLSATSSPPSAISDSSTMESMYISCIDGGGDDDDAMLQEEADGSALLPAPARTMCAVHLDFKEIALFLPASSNRHDGVVVSLPSAEAEFWATEVDRNENASDWKCTAVVSALECSTRAPVAVTRTTRSCAGGGR